MKQILIILITFFFTTNILLADDKCKNIGILQVKKMKECNEQRKLNKKDSSATKENKALNSLKTGSDKIKDASKKALGKLNTDSKLTDFIKKKMSK